MRTQEILQTIDFETDYILPLPSSSPFCAEFTRLVCAASGLPSLQAGFVSKKTIGEMLAEHQPGLAPAMARREKQTYLSQLRQWKRSPADSDVQMKFVKAGVRKYFEPMKAEGQLDIAQGSRILLVDDLLSTGGSLLSAQQVLVAHGFDVTEAVCFLGALR